MMRSTGLAVLLLAAGCFSDPPSGSDADDDTGGGSTSTSGSSTEAEAEAEDDDDDGSTTFLFGSSTTGFFATSTGLDTGSDSGVVETGDPQTVVLDIYEQCDEGLWESTDGPSAPAEVTCLNMPPDTNDFGGAWQFPEFPLGGDENVLILRPYPADGGLLQASFNTGELNIQDGATLHLDYAFVNTTMVQNDVGSMTFQVLLTPPSASPGEGMLLAEEFMEGDGTSGTIDLPLSIAGMGDDLTFVVIADTFAEGQGVALSNAFVYAP